MLNILLACLIFIGLLLVGLIILIVRRTRSNGSPLDVQFNPIKENQERLERNLKEEMVRSRQEFGVSAGELRKELHNNILSFQDAVLNRIKENEVSQKNLLDAFAGQLSTLTKMNEQKLENIRTAVQERLKSLQDENMQKLEQMRRTVDEKLHETLDKRLGESFKLVNEGLSEVQRGFGEMRSLAEGVGDLRKVLTNIKTRGTWAEWQLDSLLEEVLTPEQYAKNVVVKKGSNERVDFAIKLPGKGNDPHEQVWLPIDAKFPQENYQRLSVAQELANADLVKEEKRLLEARVKLEAKDIKEKYIDPPYTTDFGILFLPTEGLYAEVLRIPGLVEALHREYKVVIAGPMNLAALLNSLQMGFRTLAIEKRSSDVWNLLAVVKSEFSKFGEMLDKTHKKLEEASKSLEDATRKSRTIETKLRKVHELPSTNTNLILDGSPQETDDNKSESDS
jgi:DNA recombination protein RmuC